MKAAYFTHCGAPEVIEYGDVPLPIPGRGEVLVKVMAASVNPIDTYIRSGKVRASLAAKQIPGSDLAGIVESTGPGCVQFRPGDRVWCSNQGLFGLQGTCAEYCAVAEQWLYAIPDGVDFQTAAAGAMVGLTAHLGLFLHGGLASGEVVFVNGGTGGVGSAVLQLAVAAGATVITTVGSPAKAEICRQLGATAVIQYRTDDIDQRFQEILSTTGSINLWFETLRTPSLDRCIALMAKRGRLILMAGRDARPEFPMGPFYTRDLRAQGFAMFNASAEEQRAAAESLNQQLKTGAWKPLIGRCLPLSRTAEAHRIQESGTIDGSAELMGKIVLIPDA